MKNKLNNENNNNKEMKMLIRPKCDISSRKQTSNDTLGSCVVVNNDLHGTNDENSDSKSLHMSRALSGVRFSSAKNNGYAKILN